MRNPFLIALLGAGLASCATVPKPLQGQFAASSPADGARGGQTGQTVRWGGEIIKVDPKADTTCFEILGRPLGDSARPVARDTSEGRFLACRAGFYDPEVFRRGREVTVVGTVDGTQTGRVGEYDYVYPRVAATTIYLWPERTARVVGAYDPFFYDPWYRGGWGPWGPYGYGPYWGVPPVVIVKPKPEPPPKER